MNWSWEHNSKYIAGLRQFRLQHLRKKLTSTAQMQFLVYGIVHDYFSSAELEYPVIVEKHLFWLDIALPELGVDIEYDGEEWHQNTEKDEERDKLLKQSGWRVRRYNKENLYLLEDDLIALLSK